MKLFSMRQVGIVLDHDLIECGRALLLQCTFTKLQQRIDHELASIVKACLTGTEAEECAQGVCTRLAKAFSAYSASAYDCGSLLKSLFQVQPITALTAFISGRRNSVTRLLMSGIRSGRGHLLDEVPLDALIAWANEDASERFPALASVISLFMGGDDEGSEAMSPKALSLLDAAPDKEAILSRYEARFHPSSWSGSMADILERRRLAIQKLASHSDPVVVAWAETSDRKLAEWAEKERALDRSADESFE
jgi:hypothetical protein